MKLRDVLATSSLLYGYLFKFLQHDICGIPAKLIWLNFKGHKNLMQQTSNKTTFWNVFTRQRKTENARAKSLNHITKLKLHA